MIVPTESKGVPELQEAPLNMPLLSELLEVFITQQHKATTHSKCCEEGTENCEEVQYGGSIRVLTKQRHCLLKLPVVY